MDDQDERPDDEVEGTAIAAVAKPQSRRKLAIIAAAALALLGGGGFAAYSLLGSHEGGEVAAASTDNPVYVEVPEFTVNLRSPDGQARFLKLRFTLVAGDASPEEIEARLPLVLDAFQPFLRELRPEDLAGSAAVFRIKEELAIRTAAILGTGAVRDILVQDLLQQ